MEKAVVVDASVWVSRLIPSDVNYEASYLWMEQYKTTKRLMVSPAILLIEVSSAISRQTGNSEIAKDAIIKLNALSTMRIVPLDNDLILLSMNIAADLQLRAADATYVAVAQQLNIPLVSWDKEQLRKASSILAAYTPDTYP
ncbi:MAG: type II toxin-antitoxin system VapC family toxin [Ktedonobacteraceae bacterium]|nr:type II toxin-antitoxin system VapC family toxin [Ktedonobacteraceae bacterium]